MTRVGSPHPTGAELLVLHTLRCAGWSELSRVAEAAGLTEPEAESELIDLAVAGLAVRTTDGFGGWGLTAAGRAAAAERIAQELELSGAQRTVAAAYARFLVLNPELLDLCTAWQLRVVDGASLPNDHLDPDYALVLRRFADLNARADAVLTELSSALARFGRYRFRLTVALTRAWAGERDRVTDSTSSYHTVWFQLHEDLLATLGLPRE
ncbi:transcriptional regulator [Streptomyces clavuligerus]|nr:transcriptional regulator [Streptomyces clavuligerus]